VEFELWASAYLAATRLYMPQDGPAKFLNFFVVNVLGKRVAFEASCQILEDVIRCGFFELVLFIAIGSLSSCYYEGGAPLNPRIIQAIAMPSTNVKMGGAKTHSAFSAFRQNCS
jgi:hypothetical protein